MPPHRDRAAFDARAAGYESGWLGRLHHDVADRSADLVESAQPDPRRLVDIGCGTFDLVVSSTSFDHWCDQQAGLRECARILRPGGRLVLVDQLSRWLAPTMVTSRRGKARTRQRAVRRLTTAGFHSLAWHRVYAVIINGVTATI